MEKKTGSIEEKRAMLRLDSLLEFLGTPRDVRNTPYYCKYGLPTLEDARLLTSQLEIDIKDREKLKKIESEFLYYSGELYKYFAQETIIVFDREEINEAGRALYKLSEAAGVLSEYAKPQQAATETQAAAVVLPAELATETAMKYWRKARAADWVNADYSFNGTRPQMAYFAEIMAEKLGLKYKWRPFIKLWKYRYLAQERYRSSDLIGKVEEEKEIERIFE